MYCYRAEVRMDNGKIRGINTIASEKHLACIYALTRALQLKNEKGWKIVNAG